MLKARLKDFDPSVPKPSLFIYAIKLFGEVMSCMMQGGMTLILCFMGLYIKQSWLKAVTISFSYAPSFLLQHFNQASIALTLGLVTFPLLNQCFSYYVRNRMPDPRPDSANEGIYVLTSWILPCFIFAMNISLHATLNQAFLIAFAFSSINSALSLIVEPRVRNFIHTAFLVAPAAPVPVAPVPAAPAPAAPVPAAPVPQRFPIATPSIDTHPAKKGVAITPPPPRRDPLLNVPEENPRKIRLWGL